MEPEVFVNSYTILPLFFISLLTLLYFLSSSRHRRHARLPPSPRGLPVLGHLHLLAPLPHVALSRLAGRHGPLLSLRLGSVPCVVASSADAARDVLKRHEAAFSDRPQPRAIRGLTYGGADFSFAPYGAYWRFLKRACISQLLGGRTLDRLRHVRREELERLITIFCKNAKEGNDVDVGGALVGLTGDIISRMLMSRRWSGSEAEAEETRKAVAEVAELTGKFNIADYVGFCKNWDMQGIDKRVEAVHRRFDGVMERILEEKAAARRRQREEKNGGGDGENDLLDMLMDMHGDEGAEIRLTRENIKAFILDIIVAGTDTTAITIEWALSELINRPDIIQKAQAEIDTVVGTDRLVDESDIPNLPYLQAITKETLRLHPTGPLIVRQSPDGCTVNGYDIPAGATLFVNVWAIGRDPESWQEPLEFRPERFLEGSQDAGTDVRGQHFRLLPFGSGRRMCPGASLAMLVIQPALAAMIQCFDWHTKGGAPVDMEEGPGLTLPRARPLVCAPTARLNPFPSSCKE